MQEFEVKAISSVPHPTHLWLRFVDDTFVIQQAKHSQQLLQNISSQDPHIQFTTEEPNQKGAFPLLDALVSPDLNNTLKSPQCTENQHTLTSASTGIAIISLQPKTVSSVHRHLGQRWSAPINTHYNRKWTMSGKPYLHVIISYGPLTVYTPNLTTNKTTTTHKQPLGIHKRSPTTKFLSTITSPSWFPTQMDLGKGPLEKD